MEEKNVPSYWRIVAIAAVCACVVLGVLFATKPNNAEQKPAQAEGANSEKTENATLTLVEGEDPLSLWTDDAPLKKELVSYVTADRKSTRLNSSHRLTSRMPSSA